MKVNIYESDVFYNFIEFDIAYQDEEHLSEVPDELIEEYKKAKEQWENISRKLDKLKKG